MARSCKPGQCYLKEAEEVARRQTKRTPPTPSKKPTNGEDEMSEQQFRRVRASLREHAALLQERQQNEPATGNQLWRLNATGLLPSLIAQKQEHLEHKPAIALDDGETSSDIYITKREASHWLQLARDDGLW
jgi:hypothetical protein